MANMEFLNANLLNTTTGFVVEDATSAVEFFFDGNRSLSYETINFASGTTSIISFEFGTNTVISNILVLNHNINNGTVNYNSGTAGFTLGAFVTSDTSTYFLVNSITVSSIQLRVASGNGIQIRIGEWIVGERQVQFERNPSVSDFKPTIFRKQTRHVMPDGGISLYNVSDKLKVKLSWDFITTSFHNTLKDIYDPGDPLVFIQFPTTTTWTGEANEVVWSGNFDFKHSTNDKNQGFSGSINLEQTANT